MSAIPDQTGTRAALRGKTMMLFMTTLVFAELAAAFETSMIIAGMKQLLVQFERPVAVGWVLTSYLLVASGSAALGGRLGDLLGRRRLMMISLGFAIAGSLVSAMSHTLEGIIIGRGIQGLSGAILPLCLGLLRENLEDSRVPFGIGVISATAAAGAGGGLVLGGLLVDHGHWSLIFYCSALTAFIALVMTPFFVPRSPRLIATLKNSDLFGGALFVLPVAALLVTLSNIGTYGITDPGTAATLVGSAAALALWARHELRHPNPLIDVRLLTYRPILVANLCVVFFAMSAMTFPQFLILMVQQPVATGIGLGVTATVAGLIKLPGNLVTALSAPLDGYLVSRFGARAVIVLGGMLAGIGYIGFILADQQIVAFIAFSVLATGGGTMIYVAAPTIIVRNAPSDRTSEAIGVMTVLRSMFQAVGVQMTMLPLALYTKPGSSYPEADGFLISLGFLTVMTFTAALVALLFLRRGDSAQSAQAA